MYRESIEDVALFFDFENIAISLRKQNGQNPDFKKLMRWFSQHGRIVVAKAYGDWASHNSFMFPLKANTFEPVFVPTTTNHHHNGSTTIKNAVDMQIAVEATAVLHTRPHIKTFGLLTGDKDYLPLVNHLRSMGKKVIAVAVQDSTAPTLQKAVDLFVFYRDVLAQLSDQQPDPIFKLLLQAIAQLQAAGKVPLLERLKPRMQTIMNGFDEKEYTKADGSSYVRFLDFVEEAERLGLVQIVKQDNVITVKPVKTANRQGQRRYPYLPPMSANGDVTLN